MLNLPSNLTIDIIQEQPLPIAAVLIEQALQNTFDHHRLSSMGAATIELLITDDTRMQALNLEHRGVDATTDVLSLPTAINDRGEVIMPISSQSLHLGTIVISLPQAIRQTGRFGDTLEAELIGLATHGVRHLLGHNHNKAGVWTTDVE